MSPLFIAEVSSNHHRDLNRCLAFVDAAVRVGCGAVKFQLFKIESLFASEVLTEKKELRDREAWELPVKFVPPIADYCQKKGIQFSCTPFYLEAVKELEPYVSFYKIGSYELLWEDLLVACAKIGKPVVLSTGMATLEEVRRAVSVLRSAHCQKITLLHGVSSYPVPVKDCNLAALETLRREFGCPVGWSDHSVNPGVIYQAVWKWNASMIEFHLDLDGTGDEFKGGHCWLPDQITPVIKTIRESETAIGTGEKSPMLSEVLERDWRADPRDGLRPLIKTRESFRKKK